MAKRWNQFMDLLDEHRLDEAAALCQEALSQRPDDPTWLLGLASTLIGLGRLPEALEHARLAAENDSDNAAAFRTIAVVLLKMGRPQPALEAAQHALRLDPGRASVNLLNRIRGALPDPAPAHDDWEGLPTVQQVMPDPEPRGEFLAGAGKHTSVALASLPPGAELAALYGASLFGDWDESPDAAANPGWTRYLAPVLSWRAIAIIAVMVGLAGFAAGVVNKALQSSRGAARAQAAEQIRQHLRSGAVEQLAQLLEAPATSDLAHDGLLRRAHATVYRYHDADPARLVPPTGDSYDDVVAAALPLSRVDRLTALAELARVDTGVDPQAAFLRADTLVRAGDLAAANTALGRANELEPSNVLHVATRVELELAAGRASAAQNAAASALDINPYAPWTRVASWRVALTTPEPAERATTGPVARAHLAALDALANTNADAAREHLTRAISTVRGEPPFLLDWLDLFLAEGRPTLARRLVDDAAWPTSPAARASRGRLLIAEGSVPAGQAELRAAWQSGVRDPLVAIALHESGDDTVLEQAAAAWPDRFDLRIHLADTLSKRGDLSAARDRLNGVPVRRIGDSRLLSEAFTVQARIAADSGDPKEALRLVRRAVQKDDSNAAARTLLESLSSEPRPTKKVKKKKRRRRKR